MTTQAEVINAFIEGTDQPRRASNMSIREMDDGRTVLCGGRNGNAVIIAEREPIQDFTVYQRPVSRRESGFWRTDLRNQIHKAVRRFRRVDDEIMLEVESEQTPGYEN